MRRVLITGATGFTGRYLAREFKGAGYETYGLARKIESLSEYDFLYECDLNSVDGLLHVIEKVKPQYVVHLAAIAFVAHGDADEIYRTNIVGTRHLLEALRKSTIKPDAVLLASSANVYGNAHEQMLTEDVTPAPANDYAVSKLAMEYVASLYREWLPIIITRPFNYTGVGQSKSFLLPKIIDHFQRKVQVIELGNLDVARDFSDVRFVVDVYRRLLETPIAIGGTFNVCSGRSHTLQEVLQLMREISGHNIEVKVNPAFVRASEVKNLLGSRQKLEEVIGPIRSKSLTEVLKWIYVNS